MSQEQVIVVHHPLGMEPLISEKELHMKQPPSYLNSSNRSRFRKFTALVGATLLGILTACGGSSTPAPTPTASTAVQVNLGDAPADWMLAFSMNISSMTLTGNNGSVNVITGSTPMEMTRLMGTVEPVALVSAPQGTYTGASISIASCNVTYLDPTTKALVQKTIQGPTNANITFSSPVTLGSTPLAFNFDLDLANSVTMDNSGNLSLSPMFHASVGAQGAGNANSAFNGGTQQMMGVVNSVASNSFTMTQLQATNTFTFMTNAATQFQGNLGNMGMMGKGMGIMVTSTLQPDGTLLATRVGSRMNSGGIMGGGIITEVVGVPATQLTIVMQNGAGASVMTSYLSQSLIVNLTSSTEYEVDDDRIDLTKLPFTPVFDASNIYAGQSVIPISESTGMMASGMMGSTVGSITASDIRLQEQGFRGTTDVAITPATSTSFVLNLMPGCAFTTLTGADKILVYQLPGTNVENATAIPAGATLRVHGLLFKNAGEWTLVASTIAAS